MLTRTATGLLFADDFNRANGGVGANYAANGGADIFTNQFRLSGTTVEDVLGAGTIIDQHIQVTIKRDNTGYYGGVQGRSVPGIDSWYQFDARLGSGPPQIYRKTTGGFTQIGNNGTFVATAGVAARFTFSLIGTSQMAWINGLLQCTATDAQSQNQAAGKPGFNVYGGGSAYYDDLIVCSARTITVTGLPAGFKVRANGLTSAGAIAATPLVLDLAGTLLPITLIEILDATNAVVDSSTTAAYGGDVFAYAPVPNKPTITGTVLGLTVRLTGDGYVGNPSTDLQRASKWQVAAATDPTFVAPLYDSGFDLVHLATIDVIGLAPGVAMLARVQYQSALLAVSPWSDAIAIAALAKWMVTDLGPDVPGSALVQVTTAIGLGPVAGLPRGNFTGPALGLTALYDGTTATFEGIVVNPDGFVSTVGESVQRAPGTGVGALAPFVITFDQPIRGFTASLVQYDYPNNAMVLKDAGGTILASAYFPAPVPFANTTPVPMSLDVGSNLVYRVELIPDGRDWVAWQNMLILRDHLSATVGGWTATDLDPGVGVWTGTDAAPNTAWVTA